jgi:hypothetical protein
MQREVLESRKRSEKKSRQCMFQNCQNKAIKSHVLQKNGILREISKNNHLIQPLPPDPFQYDKKGLFDFKSVGINDVYTFLGFCKEHDNKIFEPIESQSELKFDNINQQALFSYRGLCQEIRRKEISIEWLNDIIRVCPIPLIHLMQSSINGYHHGIQNLTFYKLELEKAIQTNDFSSFYFVTTKIPKIDLCISVPLNIETPNQVLEILYETSFINIFPKTDSSYIIGGYHKKHPCSWTKNFLTKIRVGKKDKILKELSDLITLRLEFWAMSPQLFKKIKQEDIEKYRSLFTENVHNHNSYLKTDLNLFKNM